MAEHEASSAARDPAPQGDGRRVEPAQSPAREGARVGERPSSILFIGDLVGRIGRRTLLDSLPILRERYAPTFVVVNAENVAGGLGITPKAADELIAAGVDVI